MRLDRRPGATTITAQTYLVEIRDDPPKAVLASSDGRLWSHLSLLASVSRTDLADETHAYAPPRVTAGKDIVTVVVEEETTAWERKEVRLVCRPTSLELTVTVGGRGTLGDVTVLGGRAVLPNGAGGAFRSAIEFGSVFSPTPSEPVQVVRPAHSAVVLGVVGDAHAGRLHAVFSPPPLCLVLGREDSGGATDVPAGEWLSLAVRAGAADLRFTELAYEPVDGGFWLRSDYDGHTEVAGQWSTPTLVLTPTPGPLTAVAGHRADLVETGLAPPGPAHPPAPWWREPIFCGWGAQCARAPLPGEPASHPYFLAALAPAVVPAGVPIAPDLARQDVYDELLARLDAAGVRPGTVVIDDRWQAEYGTGEPDPDRWPDLRGWIAARHDEGRRVLLWWRAWDPAGVPAAECVRDPAGRAVAVDPGNPAYRARLARLAERLVSPDGFGADGVKVDFTQRAPAGRGLRAARGAGDRPGPWGMTALHTLLGTMYDAMKAAKPDALMITHTPHPAFADVCDMVRLNDVLERDTRQRVVAAVDQLRFRAGVVRAAMPHHLIDTDQWPVLDKEQWRAYVTAQAGLGVPALYYAEAIDRSGEALEDDDLALVARTWAAYRERIGAGAHA